MSGYEGLNNSLSCGLIGTSSAVAPSGAYTKAIITQLRENPLTGRHAPDFSQVSIEEYGQIRTDGLKEREQRGRANVLKDEATYRKEVLWEPFSEVLEEDRWRRRMALRASMLAVEKQCEREKDGTEGLSVEEQQERLAIYREWLVDYKACLPQQKQYRKSVLGASAAAHMSFVGEDKMDQWLQLVVLDHVNAQDTLFREERRAREAIIWQGLMGRCAEELLAKMYAIDTERIRTTAIVAVDSEKEGSSLQTSSDNDEKSNDIVDEEVNDNNKDDAVASASASASYIVSADSLYTAQQSERQRILLAWEDEPYLRQRIIREELSDRLSATLPFGSSRMLKLQETLGREGIEALEAFERHRGDIMAALRTMQYDVWWALVKAQGIPRRWRGEDVGN